VRRFPYERVGGDPASESEHFIRCWARGELIDMRDLDAVLVHEERCEEPRDLVPEDPQLGRRASSRRERLRRSTVAYVYRKAR